MKKEINLFGTKYKIKFIDNPEPIDVDEKDNGDYAYGTARHTEYEIIIPTHTAIDNKPIPKYDLEKNLCHEIVHCILSEGGYHNNNNDEPLVEWKPTEQQMNALKQTSENDYVIYNTILKSLYNDLKKL